MYDLYTSAGVFHSVAFGLIVSLMVICYFKAWLGTAGGVPKNWVSARAMVTRRICAPKVPGICQYGLFCRRRTKA